MPRTLVKSGGTKMKHYNQAQLASELRIQESTLRYWLNSFDEFFSPLRNNNRNHYTVHDLYKLRIIQSMLSTKPKYSYKEIHRFLENMQNDLRNSEILKDFLNKLK